MIDLLTKLKIPFPIKIIKNKRKKKVIKKSVGVKTFEK